MTKRFFLLLLSFSLTAGCFGQSTTVTPNIGLQVPAFNQPNWQVPLNYDLNRLDLLLSGNLPLPGTSQNYLLLTSVPFASLENCTGISLGTVAAVSDSTTNAWGATISGGGSSYPYVEAYCNGTAWIVNPSAAGGINNGFTNPMTAFGDLLYQGLSGPARLAGNTTNTPMYLKSLGSGGIASSPVLAQINVDDLTGNFPLGNQTNVIDASKMAGADECTKLNNAVAVMPSSGGFINAQSLSGGQACNTSVTFSSSSQPITILLAGGLTLTRTSGSQFQIGTNGRLIGQGRGSTVITGTDSTAAVYGHFAGGNPPSNVEISRIQFINNGIGAGIDFLQSGGVVGANIHDNIFQVATGVMITGYYSQIYRNFFYGNPGGTMWAGTVLDTNGGGQPNANHIYDNVYQGNAQGTGDFVRGGYSDTYDGVQDYENGDLAMFISGAAINVHLGGDVENLDCNSREAWAPSTTYGRGAVIYDSNGNCEIDVTPTTSGYSTTSSLSTPAWSATQGGTVADNGVTWEMYSGSGGESAFIVLDSTSGTNVVDGTIGANPYIDDLAYVVNGSTNNSIHTVGNLAWGSSGSPQYNEGAYGGLGSGFILYSSPSVPTQAIGSFNFGMFNSGDPNSILNGAEFDIPSSSSECTTYQYCGHLNVRMAQLQSVAGITDHGPVNVYPLPDPAAPTVSVVGTAGSTSATYYLVAHVNGGVTLPSSGTTITNTPDSLSGTNYDLIKVPTIISSFNPEMWSDATWDVLKGDTSTSLYTNIRIGPGGVGDQGGATRAYTTPSRNTTGDVVVNGQFRIASLTPSVTSCMQISTTGVVSETGSACSGSGSSIFTSFQPGSNTAITGTGNYFQIALGSGMTDGGVTGAGTSGSPYVWTIGSTGGGSGLSSFTTGNLSPLFTAALGANPTTAPALAFILSSAAQNSVLAGPPTGGAGAPSYQTAPTISAANMTGFPSVTVNTETCSLGSSCTIPFQHNTVNNTSLAGINLINSTVNAVGLSVTISNPATNQIKAEITGGSYSGTSATASAAATTPGLCPTGQAPTGILANFSATGCALINLGLSNPMTVIGQMIGAGAAGSPAAIAAGLTGQVVMATHAATPVFTSPGLAGGNGGSNVSASTYTVQCDTGTAIIDRGTTLTFASGAATVTVPDPADSGCTGGFAFVALDNGAGPLVFNRESAATFSVYYPAAGIVLNGQTTLTVQNGANLTFNADATEHYNVRVIQGVADIRITVGTTTIPANSCLPTNTTYTSTPMPGLRATMVPMFAWSDDYSSVWTPAFSALYFTSYAVDDTLLYQVCNASGIGLTLGSTVVWNVSSR